MAATEQKRSEQLVFYVNRQRFEIPGAQLDVHKTLLRFLRDEGFTGTKLGCHEAACGSCTVLVSHYDPFSSKVVHRAVNACIAPLCSVAGSVVTTVEGIGSTRSRLHPVQQRLADSHGSQCGFCTPGFVMSMYALLQNDPAPTQESIEHALDGNLCRCTGYRPILDAFKSFCPTTNQPCHCEGNLDEIENAVSPSLSSAPYDHSHPLNAPPSIPDELLQFDELELSFGCNEARWIRPLSLQRLLRLRTKGSQVAVGFSELGIDAHFRGLHFQTYLSPARVAELNRIEVKADGVQVGAAVSLDELRRRLHQLCETLDETKVRVFAAFVRQLDVFAGTQVRNVACLGGNLCTASPISDLNPLHVAADSELTLVSLDGLAVVERRVLARDFFVSYRGVDLHDNEILLNVRIPFSRADEHFRAFKVARRQEDDIAIVCAGMRMRVDSMSGVISDVALGFGGMAATTVRTPKTERAMVGSALDDDTMLSDALSVLAVELSLPPNAPGGMVEYRQALASSMLFKFVLSVRATHFSTIDAFKDTPRLASRGLQHFDNQQEGIIGSATKHMAGDLHATGEAQYTDDTAVQPRALFAELVLSTKAHAKLLKVDPCAALALKGVHSYIDHRDVPGCNMSGPVVLDEEIFASDRVDCIGAVIGLILAESAEVAREAAKLVVVDYDELDFVLSIEDAIRTNSFHEPVNGIEIVKGDIDAAFASSDIVVVEGDMQVGGQEHFYLETQATVATPGEHNEIEIVCSTQNPSKTQSFVAKALGVPKNRVVVRCKRMGGGFGGKETRNIFVSSAVAVAAVKSGRQVRIMLQRDIDMCTTGRRHSFVARYRVGARRDGRIVAVDTELFSNGGCSADLSVPVMERALFHAENAYDVAAFRCRGRICKTNQPSNTAFRGFGAPQSLLVAEVWIEHVARRLNIPREKVAELNLFGDDSSAYFGQPMPACPLREMWNDVNDRAAVQQRRKEVDAFNAVSKYRKRGLAMVPVRFGMSFTLKFMNQAGALVHLYTDGTVLVSHGGTEMGQGLHTKMAAVAAHEFNIPISDVHISETSTDKVANTQPTAASVSADLNGAAVQVACRQILDRLEPVRAKLSPDVSLAELALAAHLERINLSANGFYATPNLGFDFASGEGRPFNYFAYGVACTEVELDCLTGELVVLRADIVHDVGKSLNPAIDIGQIEGAFVQGLGLFLLEESVLMSNGALFTRGPSTYKIPAVADIPIDFRVGLYRGKRVGSSITTIHSSKGVGEPPLFLGASAFFAAKDAIYAYRAQQNPSDNQPQPFLPLDSPATCERLRMACADRFTRPFASDQDFRAKGCY